MNILKSIFQLLKVRVSNFYFENTKIKQADQPKKIGRKEERNRIIEIFVRAKLSKQRRNDLFDAMVNYGFMPEDFIIEEIENNQSASFYSIGFYHVDNTQLECSVGVDLKRPNEYWLIASPYLDRVENSSKGNWETSIRFFSNWLSSIKNDLALEEKWNFSDFEIPNLTFNSSEDINKFTEKELTLLNHQLDQLTIQFKELDLSDEVLSDLDEKILELKKQSHHLSKANWQQFFVGAIMQTIFKFSIAKENATSIWTTIKNTFSDFF